MDIAPFYLGNVAFMWQMTGNPYWTNINPVRVLTNMAAYYLSNNYDQLDQISMGDQEVIRNLGFGYDWLYDVMNTNQRAVVLSAIDATTLYLWKGVWWKSAESIANGSGTGDPNRIYPGPYLVQYFSSAKQGNSHGDCIFQTTWPAILAAFGDDTNVAALFNIGLNYELARTFPFGSLGGLNQGRGYNYSDLFQEATWENLMLCQIGFPESQLNLIPFVRRTADWLDRTVPVGFSEVNDPWGDDSSGRLTYWGQLHFGRDIALFSGSGIAQLHFQNEAAISYDGTPVYKYDEFCLPFYFTPPAPQTNMTLAAVYPEEGWVSGSTYPPNTLQCFSNGVGFVFQARPRGAQPSAGTGHAHSSDLSYQMWAYGAAITDAGDHPMDSYAKVPWSHYSLLVNGLGTFQPTDAQVTPYYARIMAFTNAPDYVYCAADGTAAYPRGNFYPGGWLTPAPMSALYANAPLAALTRVQRHILFEHHQYFVIYDELSSTNPSTFTMLYHVLENTLSNLNGASFTYSATNQLAPNKPPVTVLVSQVVSPALLSVQVLTGTNVQGNPITGENYWQSGVDTPRANAVWVSSLTPATNFHFMTVIYPVAPGGSMPTITRLDDYTVAVTNGAQGDVISFNPQTTNAATFLVHAPAIGLAGLNTNPPVNYLSAPTSGGTQAAAVVLPPALPAPANLRTIPPVPAGSTPVPGFWAWWNPDTLSGANGTPVSAWVDSSAAARHAGQTTTSKQPALNVGARNGHNALSFNGTSQTLVWPNSTAAPQPLEIFVVCQLNDVTARHELLSSQDTSGGLFLCEHYGDGTTSYGCSENAGSWVIPSRPFSTNWTEITFIYNGPASQVWKDYSPVGSGDCGTNGFKGISIGSYLDQLYWNGQMGDILIYTNVLNLSDQQFNESLLRGKYGF